MKNSLPAIGPFACFDEVLARFSEPPPTNGDLPFTPLAIAGLPRFQD
jgi:hypothetical protein